MSRTAAARTDRTGRTPVALVLRVLTAAALAVSAWLHVDLAAGPRYSDGQITLAGLFVAQAVVAGLVALWVLVLADRLSWVAAAVVGAVSLGALVLSVYVEVPSVGPFPTLYEPLWYRDKVVAAVAAGVAAVAAGAGLAVRSRSRR